jgi:long-chain acyl-CoA synthetase
MAATSPTAVPAPPALDRSTHSTTLGAMVLAAADRFTGTAIRYYDRGQWRDLRYPELGLAAREIARGLIGLGIKPGDPVAIFASTRPEWTLADCGALCAGAVVVPVYHTNSAEECHYVLEHSGARVVFCDGEVEVEKIRQVRDRLPQLEHIVTFDRAGDELSLEGLRRSSADVPAGAVQRAVAAVSTDDVATIIYTSGTTGPPKGCRTTHRNCLATMAMYEERVWFGPEVVAFMFLPLAHSLARMVQMVILDIGGTLAFWRGDTQTVIEDLAEVRPTHVPSVPRVFEKIHTKALAGAEEAGRLQRTMLDWAVGVGGAVRANEREGRSIGPLLRGRHAIADRLVLRKVRDLFGGRIQLALTGAAPITQDVLDFFDACGVIVLEGYGLTESTAAATLNTIRERLPGSVGRPLPGTGVRIADDGEILLRGDNIFAGYHRNDEATRDSFTEDGWLRTGDLGLVDDQGYVRVTGRKKDLIITSSGKNISPSNLESALQDTRWISQAVVYGDNHPYLVAAVTLDADEAPALAARCGVPADPAVMAHDPKVRAVLQEDIDAVNANVARIEQVKRFVILDRELTQEDGELTPTMKIRRNVVNQRYRDVFEGLYAEAPETASRSE